MSLKKGQSVEVVDTDLLSNDPHLEESALEIISSSNYKGEVTKVFTEEDGDVIFSVGFKNDLGWVTQGFKEHEIRGVK